jgi:hypothetical protein
MTIRVKYTNEFFILECMNMFNKHSSRYSTSRSTWLMVVVGIVVVSGKLLGLKSKIACLKHEVVEVYWQ